MDGQVALVTGASRGIGAAIAVDLARAGYTVVINHRDSAEDARRVAEAGGPTATVIAADVADHAAVRRLTEEVTDRHGRLDVLVNNAGVTLPDDWRTLDPARWQRCLDVNVTGVFHCVQALAPLLEATGRGRIVNIGSTYAGMGVGAIAAYAAAKAGIAALTTAFAKELAPVVTVNLVAPGNIDTDMTRSVGEEFVAATVAQTPLRRLGTPEEIARLVRFVVSEDAAFITGQTLVCDGGHSLR
ncbi:3-oxoacyl-ACP reductase FabG [Actinokineospora sp. NBRC 105648]|uniref:SDR family NAD(P)-dependent oxidoreductase n=1 Tax=Actinokineospora sp. NBRC 105648 TaxID=3032206 RepID=UPI002555A971|nr:3-oxoacyl-ACP reductase FabG [Actinokineospora sp. NBRC 105648]